MKWNEKYNQQLRHQQPKTAYICMTFCIISLYVLLRSTNGINHKHGKNITQSFRIFHFHYMITALIP